MGMMQVRQQILQENPDLQDKFDNAHEPILTNLFSAFEALHDMQDLINSH